MKLNESEKYFQILANHSKNIIKSLDKNDCPLYTSPSLEDSYYDYLTGLPTRRLFTERLKQALVTSKENGNMTALMAIDFDDFKKINDSYGHTVGDEVIKEFATRVKTIIWKKDTLTRLGGDKYIIVFPSLRCKEEIEAICDQIIYYVETPMYINGVELQISTSIGVSFYPDASNEEELYQIAKENLYTSKKYGGSTYTF